MSRVQNRCTIWLFGLTEETGSKLARFLESRYALRAWPAGEFPDSAEFEKDRPCLAILAPEAHRACKALHATRSKHLKFVPQAIYLESAATPADLEYAIDSDCVAVMRHSLSKAAIMRKITAALEVEAVQLDALRMSREVYLEREILERKNEVLQFLVSFLTQTSSGLDPAEIIRTTFSSLKLLFPVRSIHAALWKPGSANCDVELFLTADEESQSFADWRSMMLEEIGNALPAAEFLLHVHQTRLLDQESEWRNASPREGHVLRLPISIAGTQIGFLCILTDMIRSLSRDQALALNSALQFLALTLNNAHSFQDVKQQADYDALTGVYSRRHFETRLVEEVERANRLRYPLSIIFCDIDHFKQVNDTLGHKAGDEVLSGVAATIREIVREQDYAARYGGEEFVILLPRTSPKRAMALAERLRKAVGERQFRTEGGNVSLTISMGISGSQAEEEKNGGRLLQKADMALYQAKKDNRNCVREFTDRPETCALGAKVAI